MHFINEHLAARYTNGNGTFVTAFYGIYNTKTRTIVYSSAGHCPPRQARPATTRPVRPEQSWIRVPGCV